MDSALGELEARGLSAESHKDWRRAAAAWRLVLGHDSVYAPAVLGLARAQQAQGDFSGAIHTLQRLPADPKVVDALAGLLEASDPAQAARLYGRLQSLRLGDPEPHRKQIVALTRSDPVQALDELDLWLALVDGEPDGRVFIDLAQALRDQGDEEAASAVLSRYIEAWPQGALAEEARGRLDRMAVERAARELSVGASRPLSLGLRSRVERARSRAVAGQLEPALADLREVVKQAPRAAEAWGALGDVHTLLGRVDEAERAYAWAAALAPDEATWHARLGMLLADRYGGRRDAEADELLSRALALRPTWSELHYRQGRLRQARGDWAGATGSLRAYLDAEPDGAFATAARQTIADLQRTAPSPPQVHSAAPQDPSVPSEALRRFRIARVYWDQADLDASRTELAQALGLAPDWPAALNLDAALKMQAGDDAGALRSWRRSLKADPAQPLVQLNLGQRLRVKGDRVEADRLLTAAAKGGAEDAWYLLAELAIEDHRIFDARHYLDQYAASATGGISREAAAALSTQVDRQILLLKAVVGGVSGGILLLALAWVVRRRISKPLSALIAQAPEANHDLARLLSAIRHEVLKHNTTLLDEVALALENGDYHAVAWAAARLFGASRDEPGVVDRFDDYLKAISRLGRKHGVRLDLRHRDPVLAPMWRAMRRLRRLAPLLRRPARAGGDVPARLRALSARLNDQGYRALGRLIQQMGRLRLHRGLLVSVDARVRAEPAFEGADLPALELDLPPRPVPVRVSRGDLEDILANLLRNAYTAVIEGMGPGLRRAGVSLREEDDPITGIEHVVIEVLDNAPGHLSEEMIRGRGIGRGLGLTVDLINRHDGSIHVGSPPSSAGLSYTKAVIVRLPRAEEGEEA